MAWSLREMWNGSVQRTCGTSIPVEFPCRANVYDVPLLGTIDPETGTRMSSESLATVLFSKARRAVLGLILSHPDRAFYLREIVKLTSLGIGQLQRELEQLTTAGVIRRFEQGRHVYFQADQNCPVYDELREIIFKTVGVADELRRALSPLRDRIRVAFIFGSVARGEENSDSDLDVMVIGDVTLAQVVEAVRGSEATLLRPVNPTVYPVKEFTAKLVAKQHFLTRVLASERVLLIGDEHDLAALS